MRFSYNAVWEDALMLLRRNAALLAAIAGVFLFLPAVTVAILLPPPVPAGDDMRRFVEQLIDYYQTAGPWLTLENLLAIAGTLAMLRLIFARETVGAALVRGLLLTPLYFLLSIVCGFAIGLGLLLLLAPGLYLIGRLVPLPAVLAAENRLNPLSAISRTFALTKGHGWAVFGLVFIVGAVAFIFISMAHSLFGIIFIVAAGQELGKLLSAVMGAALSAALVTLLTMLYAAIYRALAGANAAAAAAFE
jgi:hypothetical protein